jgi:hypothetical protein
MAVRCSGPEDGGVLDLPAPAAAADLAIAYDYPPNLW